MILQLKMERINVKNLQQILVSHVIRDDTRKMHNVPRYSKMVNSLIYLNNFHITITVLEFLAFWFVTYDISNLYLWKFLVLSTRCKCPEKLISCYSAYLSKLNWRLRNNPIVPGLINYPGNTLHANHMVIVHLNMIVKNQSWKFLSQQMYGTVLHVATNIPNMKLKKRK